MVSLGTRMSARAYNEFVARNADIHVNAIGTKGTGLRRLTSNGLTLRLATIVPYGLWLASFVMVIYSALSFHVDSLPGSAIALLRVLPLCYWVGLALLSLAYVLALHEPKHAGVLLVICPISFGFYIIAFPQLMMGILYYLDSAMHFAGSLYVTDSGRIPSGSKELAAYPFTYVWGSILQQVGTFPGLGVPKFFPFLGVALLGLSAYLVSRRILGELRLASIMTTLLMVTILAEQTYFWFSPDFLGYLLLACLLLTLTNYGTNSRIAPVVLLLGVGALLSDPGINLVTLLYLLVVAVGAPILKLRVAVSRLAAPLLVFGFAYDFFSVAIKSSWSLLTYLSIGASNLNLLSSLLSQTALRYSNPQPLFGLANNFFAIVSLVQIALGGIIALRLLTSQKNLTPSAFFVVVLFACVFLLFLFGSTTYRPRTLQYLPLASIPVIGLGIKTFHSGRYLTSKRLRTAATIFLLVTMPLGLFIGYSVAPNEFYSSSQQSAMAYVVSFSNTIGSSTVDDHLGLLEGVLIDGSSGYLAVSNAPTYPNLGEYTNTSAVCPGNTCPSANLSTAVKSILARFTIIAIGGPQAPAEWALRFSLSGIGVMRTIENGIGASKDRVGDFGAESPTVIYG